MLQIRTYSVDWLLGYASQRVDKRQLFLLHHQLKINPNEKLYRMYVAHGMRCMLMGCSHNVSSMHTSNNAG